MASSGQNEEVCELPDGGSEAVVDGRARVLLLARAPEADPARPELAELLGPERYVRLEQLMLERALAWAAGVARGRVTIAYEPAGAALSLGRLAGDDVSLFAQTGDSTAARRLGAVERMFRMHSGPVLVAWPDLPSWRPAHAAGAIDDLRAGCDVSVGPMFDGGFYLLALARPAPSLLELSDEEWRGPESMGRILAAAHSAGLQVGLLRAERGLRRPADLRAALADPLADGELAGVLRTG